MSSSAVTTRSGEPRTLPGLPISAEKGNEILGFLMAALAVLLLGSLISYHPDDPSWLHHAVQEGEGLTQNFIGPFGAQLAASVFGLIGTVAFLLPALLGFSAWRRLTGQPPPDAQERSARAAGTAAVVLISPALLQLLVGSLVWQGSAIDAGGALGVVLSDFLSAKLNRGGAFVVLATVLLVAGSLVARSTLGELVGRWRERWGAGWQRGQLLLAQRAKRRREQSARRRVVERHVRGAAASPGGGVRVQKGGGRGGAIEPLPKPSRVGLEPVAKAAKGSSQPRATVLSPLPAASKSAAASAAQARGEVPAWDEAEPLDAPAAPAKLDLPLRVTEKKGEGHFSVRKVPAPPPPLPESSAEPPEAEPESAPEPQQEALEVQAELPELPPVNLLDTDRPVQNLDQADLVHRGEVIHDACRHFGVEGEVTGISPGPVITVFEFQPAPGVKVSKVVNLQDDLALALKADSVRIDRIPGRSTLGMEVPNDTRSVIHLGQQLAEPAFTKSRSVLTMALGVDIHGEPLYFDLARMPHLLVAGATGAGKSVGLQSMITSILYKATKDEVKFIFIDPKRVELGVYAQIPHLKTEVVVEPKKAANALRWAVAEMERRYRLLAEVHVRSIDIYNRAITDPKERARLSLAEGESEFTEDDFKPLPYYVIIIDELADLMLVAASEVETSIARLAQMARAVGIHLIIATQRPSVDVLTGTIKANFPCRLAFATATRHDSRTILDQVGAEKLLGRGDALFMPPGPARFMRLHGASISEQETASLIRWLRRRGKPDLDPDVVKAPEEDAGASGGGEAGGEQDALFDDAARLVVRERQASASFLQRRMRVGFSRAARLIDMLEADGLLGPAQGSKPRDVLVPPDFFEEIDGHHDQE
ncbi:MAG: DNA translocase FtsK [Acidobacteriota bacterium]